MSSTSTAALPPEFFCPLTKQLLIDPVSTADGAVFERAFIEQRLRIHCSNPISGAALPSATLVPNLPLAQLIRTMAGPAAIAAASAALAAPAAAVGAPTAAASPAASPAQPAAKARKSRSPALMAGSPALMAGSPAAGSPSVSPQGYAPSSLQLARPHPSAPTAAPPVGGSKAGASEASGVAAGAREAPKRSPTRREQLELWRQQKAANSPRKSACGNRPAGNERPAAAGMPPAAVDASRQLAEDPAAATALATVGVAARPKALSAVEAARAALVAAERTAAAEEAAARQAALERGERLERRSGGIMACGAAATAATATAGTMGTAATADKVRREAVGRSRPTGEVPAKGGESKEVGAGGQAAAPRAPAAPLAQRPASRVNAPTAEKAAAAKEKAAAEERALQELLKSHNAKFKEKPKYEPRTQSVAQMREWEKRTGKQYMGLSYEERVAANQEINMWAKEGKEGAVPVE